MDELDAFLNTAKSAGWTITSRKEGPLDLGTTLPRRFSNLSTLFLDFLNRVETFANPADDVWFLCESDYSGTSESDFRWNEWELMSLNTAGDDTDWAADISDFWDKHLPIVLSVKGDYAYLAIRMNGEGEGAVVKGFAPEFESPMLLASSYPEFLRQMSLAIRDPAANPELDSFV